MTLDETRPRVTPNLAYGICLVLLGGTLILDRMQLVEARQILQFWPLALVLVGATLVIQSFQRADAGADTQSVNLGPAIALVVVGLVMTSSMRDGRTFMRSEAGETASLFAVMSHNQQVSRAATFRSADMTAVLGHSELDLRQTTVAPGEEADIEVFTLMGGTTIRVPEGWTVVVRTVPIMGGVKDQRRGARDLPGSPKIVVRGLVMMGGLNIRS